MSRLAAFVTAAKSEQGGLDQMMSEVYTALTTGQRDFAMVDGGAHKGWHTHRMLRLRGCGAVYAVEADPSMGEVLTDNLAAWRAKRPQPSAAAKLWQRLQGRTTPELHLVRAALQNDPMITEIPWMSSHSHVGRSSIRATDSDTPSIWTEHKDVAYRDETTVPAVTLDGMLAAETRALPFIKLDLEGADFLALQGARATLAAKRPLIAFENSSRAPQVHGYTLDDLSDFFAAQGYVPLNYVGAPMTHASWFDFYEAWAVPQEAQAHITTLINRAVTARIGESA